MINPISTAKIDELIEVLCLPEPANVLDIACGKGELLARLAARTPIVGTGVDLSPYFVAAVRANVAARVQAPSHVEILCADGRDYSPKEPLDLAMCVGASWVFGGHAGTLAALRGYVRPGGLILVGEPYWHHDPDPAYLAATGETPTSFLTHAGNVQAGIDAGLVPLYSVDASVDDWDRYEWLRVQAGERYVYSHPEDPDGAELLQRSRENRDIYLRWARDTVGWALYLFFRP